MIKELFEGLNKKAVSPVIAIVLLLMMTVAAAGAAYFWLTQMQSGIQKQTTKSIENIMQSAGRRLIAQAAICERGKDLTAWWLHDEGSGNITYDYSENDYKGTMDKGLTWTGGKVGKALESFNWNEEVFVGGSNVSGAFTVVAWGYGTRSVQRGMVTKGGVFDLRAEGDNSFFKVYNGTTWISTVAGNIWPSDSYVWHQVVGVYNGSHILIFVDENLRGTNKFSYKTQDSTSPIDIGGGANGWVGKLDEIRIYNRSLSEQEVKRIYQNIRDIKMKVRVTVRNVGSVKIPKAKFVANLKKDGTTVDSDTYTTKSSIKTDDLKTLTFYFNEMRPGGEYNINIPGIDVSQAVKCQSLES